MFACADCSRPEGRMIWFEPNPHDFGTPWNDAFIPLAPSMEVWLRNWLDGIDMFEAPGIASEGEDWGT
jgi:hypothetical protein